MGALALFRKRPIDFLSFSTDSPDKSNQIDTNTSKKRRISYSNKVSVEKNSVSRIRKYPEPVGLRREVHAPCRSNRGGFLSNNGGVRVSDSVKRLKEGSFMGNVIGSVIGSVGKLRSAYESKKRAAFDVLRHVKVEEKGSREFVVIEDGDDKEAAEERLVSSEKRGRFEKVKEKGSREFVVIEDGDDEEEAEEGLVSSKKRGRFESSGWGLVVEQPHDLDRKGLENLVESDENDLHSAMRGREAYKDLLSKLDKKYTSKLRDLDFEIKLNETKLQSVRSLTPAKKQQDEKKPEEDLLRAAFAPLSEDEEAEVKSALLNANRRKILVTHENSNIPISGEILQCLRPGAWLNDEVINVYLELLKERERREPKKHLTCHFFNTFFYKKLIGGRNGYDYKAVKRWTSLRKLGYKLNECDKIFIPIHKEVHWCLAVINKKDKTFQYLDSLGGRDSQVLRVLAKYYVDEVKDKCGEDVDVTSWALEYVEDLPEQQNGFDCGVFMIKYADFYSKGTGLHFSQENMPYFRRRTAKEILRLEAH